MGEGGFGRILEAIPEVVLVVDRAGFILFVNHVEPGYDRDQVVGMNVDTTMTPKGLETFTAALESVFDTKEVAEYEVETTAPDGSAQWYRSRMAPLCTAGRVDAVMVQATNITELKAAQEELDRLRRFLPMCAWCRRIQNNEGEWESVEAYLGREARTKVSHGLCSDCYQEQMDGASSKAPDRQA
ncbi:MAG: PAS domain S-box protein [Gemmatimonadetes bacterium]|nr:PAS domain S-box protein [Gemmatimonadota bacterium]